MSQEDKFFFDRWQAHRDEDAFAELVARHSGMMYAAAKRVLGSGADAEDVVQESFVRLARQSQTIASVPGWLHHATINLSLTRLRGEKRRHLREDRYHQERTTSQTDTPHWDEILPVVDEAIADLPDKIRSAVVLRFLEAKTHAAIAKELGISRTAVQKRIEKGLNHIRTALKKHGVTSSSAALATLFATHLEAQAAPPALLATLGKQTLTLSHTAPTLSKSNLLLKGLIAMSTKKTITTLGAIALVILLAFLSMNKMASDNTPNSPDNIAALSDTNTSDPQAAPSSTSSTSNADTSSTTTPEESNTPAAATDPQNTSPQNENSPEDEEDPETEENLAAIAGLVKDKDAFPVPGARVILTTSDENHREINTLETTSGEDGRYAFSAIALTEQGWKPGGAFGKLFADSKNHVMQIREIWHLQSGESRTDVDITLTPASGFVKGSVVSADGSTVPDARVSLVEIKEPDAARGKMIQWTFTFTDAEGHFEIPVPASPDAHCTVTVTKQGRAEGRFSDIRTGTENARFVLPDFGIITGHVANQNGTPAVDTVVAVTREQGINDIGQPEPLHAPKYLATTDAEGYYRLEELSPHFAYHIGVFDKPEFEVRREWWDWMVFGNREQLRMQAEIPDLHVEPGELLSGIDFQLADEYYIRLSGHIIEVETRKPAVKHVIVFTFTTPEGKAEPMMYYTDDKGFYQAEVLRDEETDITDFRAYYTSELGGFPAKPVLNAEDEQPLQPFSISPGDDITLDLLVPAPVTIPVSVIDENGKPVTGVGIGVGRIHPDGRWDYKSIHINQVDENGQFVILGIPPGFETFVWVQQAPDDTLLAETRTPLAQFGPITGESGETVPEVLLVIQEKGGIEGTITDPEGNPLTNLPITITAPHLQDEEQLQIINVQTDKQDAHFTIVHALSPALYPEITITATINGTPHQATFQNAEVLPESIINLGTIPLQPIPDNTNLPQSP